MENKTFKKLLISVLKHILPTTSLVFIRKQYYKINTKLFLPERELELSVLKSLINKNDYVMDIGANIGVYTKCLSELVGKNGKIYSIEPIPVTYDILKSNIKYFKLNNVETFNYAISDKAGKVNMIIPTSEYGNENYYEAMISSNQNIGLNNYQIDSVTIDSLTENPEKKISFIKIDTEGHELNCIRGGKNLLAKSKPILLIEVSENPEEQSSTAYILFKELEEFGYYPYWYDGKEFWRRKSGINNLNYFFFNTEHISALKESIKFNN